MVSRVEWLLIAAILFFATRGIVTEISQTESNSTAQQKQLELLNAQLQEVNETAIQSIISASRMVKYPDKTLLEEFRLHTPELTLVSHKATEHNDTITLEHNASILKADGTRYHATDARYHKDTAILELSETFGVTDRRGEINGSTMQYNPHQQEIRGTEVRAKYEME
jgi:hypothetical protein